MKNVYIILAKNLNDDDGQFTEQVPYSDAEYLAESPLEASRMALEDENIVVDVEASAARLASEGKTRIVTAVVNTDTFVVTLVEVVPHLDDEPHFDLNEIPYSSLVTDLSLSPTI